MNKFYVIKGEDVDGVVYIGSDDAGSRLQYLQGAYFYTDREDAEYACAKANLEFSKLTIPFSVHEALLLVIQYKGV